MKYFLFVILLLFIFTVGKAQNLALTATLSGTNYNVPITYAADENISTVWQSNPCIPVSYTHYLIFQLAKGIRMANVIVSKTNIGFTLSLSKDGTTWTDVRTATSGVSVATFANVYIDFSQFTYIKISTALPPNGYITIGDVEIYDVPIVIGTVYPGAPNTTGHGPELAFDMNDATYYETQCDQNTCISPVINVGLSKTVSAVKVRLKSANEGISVSFGTGSITQSNYYTTIQPNDEFYVLSPDGFNYMSFIGQQKTNKIYEITITEVPVQSAYMPIEYDNAGNMTKRTIVFSSTKSDILPLEENIAYNPPSYIDKLGDKEINIYPNPTHGELRVVISSLAETEKASIRIFSQSGINVLTKTNATIDNILNIEQFAAGTYFLTIEINGKQQSWKIIKL